MASGLSLISKDIGDDFPSLTYLSNNTPPVYFDNACTSLVPLQVIEEINRCYSLLPTCAGDRSGYSTAEETTRLVEEAREKVRKFINAGPEDGIIFTANTSHALNIVALGYPLKPGQVVIQTDREHNSNHLPWIRLKNKGLIRVVQIDTDENGNFDLDSFKKHLDTGLVGLVSMGYTSNIIGNTIPAKEIISLAHKSGVKVLLDAAQAAPHRAINVKGLEVDMMAFSLHKMCGPRGVGVLYISTANMNKNAFPEPVILGGGTAGDATYASYSLLDSPECFEVGVQNYPAIIAAGSAIEYLGRIGMDKIARHVTCLNTFLTNELMTRYGGTGWFRILGPLAAEKRGSILTFEIKRPNAFDIAKVLSEKGNVMVRSGAFCVHSYLNRLYGEGWTRPALADSHRMTYRVSFYLYNTIEECRIFLDTLDMIFKERGYL